MYILVLIKDCWFLKIRAQAAYKGEVDIFANEPFDRKNFDDKLKLLDSINYVLERRLHLLQRNLNARKWNRQFLGTEPTAEELEQDKADEALIASANKSMRQAQSAAHIAKYGVPTAEELDKLIKEKFGSIEKWKEALKAALQ